MQVVLMLVIGLSAGMLSVLLGVGGGIIIVPALVYFAGLDIRIATGTSLAVIVPTAIVGAIQRAQGGHVNWQVAAIVAAGAIFGAFAGARLAAGASPEVLRRGFAVLMVFTAVRMLLPGR